MNIKKLLKIALCCCLSVCLVFSCWNVPIKTYADDINTSNNNAEVDSNEVEASDNPQKSTDSKNNENSKSTATPNTAQNNTDYEGLESSNKSESKNINKKPRIQQKVTRT